MGSTPTYGLRYPELTDEPNGPLAFETLAEDVEVEVGRIDDRLNSNLPLGIVARNRRTTSSALFNDANEHALISLSVPVKAGRTYKLCAPSASYSANGYATVTGQIRITSNGSDPITNGTLITASWVELAKTNFVETKSVCGFYEPTSDHTLRATLVFARVRGTASVQCNVPAGWGFDFYIEDLGVN